MYRGLGHVSGECFTSLNFVCFRSQYVGAVNSKLSAELRVSALRVFAIAVLTTFPSILSTYRAIRPSLFRLTEVRGKALPDINFVNNELPASTRETLYPSFRRSVSTAVPSFSSTREVCRYNLREHISRASRGNFSSARRNGAALAKQLRFVAIFFWHCAAGVGERRVEL